MTASCTARAGGEEEGRREREVLSPILLARPGGQGAGWRLTLEGQWIIKE